MRYAFRSECLVASASLAVLVLTLGGSAEAKQKPGKKGRERETRCLEVRVTSPQSQERRRTGRFSATEILDLRVEVRLPRQIESSQQVVVKLFTPDGHLYQDLQLTTVQGELGDTSATTRRRRTRDGSSEPRTKASGTASTLFPVAGTSIVTSSLYGRWTATVDVEGAEASCARPVSFVITE